MDNLDELKAYLTELTHLKSALAVLQWDAEVHMPLGGVTRRAQTISYLTQLLHEKFLHPDFERLLNESEQGRVDEHEQAMIAEVRREFDREKKLPTSFVTELAHLTAEATHVWAAARKKSDFTLFAPTLEKIVTLKQQEAELVGFSKSPYDALLDTYEPYLTCDDIFIVFEELKDFLIPFVKKIAAAPVQSDSQLLRGTFAADQQKEFNQMASALIGFDFQNGRLDSSAHPFSIGFHPDDVRITTRYDEYDVLSALMASLHEAGHGMYEQGLSRDHFGTPLGESASMGIHESQSRLWENMVGRSRPFWEFLYPRLQMAFPRPFRAVSFEDFYRALNRVHLSPIRVEADEVTYNLHIILRFEIEKQLIEGSIRVGELPDIWRGKMNDYFGLNTTNDAEGVLQDIHWSNGLFGYFPTYTLGNLYSAQLFAAAEKQIADLPGQMARGEFSLLREWLRTNIHTHGKRFSASDLIQAASGESLTSQYFIEYLTQKYSAIYALS